MNSQESGEFVGDYQSMVGVTLGDSGVGFNNPIDNTPSSATTTTYHISADHLQATAGTGSGELGHEQIVVVNGDEVQIITADDAVMVNADEAIMVNADGEGVACFDVVGGTAGTAKVEPLPMPADSFEGQAASVLPNHPTQFGTDHHALQSGISTTDGGDVLIVVDDTINPSKIETTDDDVYLAENPDAVDIQQPGMVPINNVINTSLFEALQQHQHHTFQQEAQMNSTATSTPTMIIDPAVQELMAGLPSTTTTVTVSEPPQTPGSSQQPTTQAAVAGGHLILPPPFVQVGHEKASTATVSWRHPNELVEEVDDDPDDPSETPPSSADQRGCQVAPATTPAVGAKTLDMGFVYTLDTPTSALVKCGEDSLTYLNLHQMYTLVLELNEPTGTDQRFQSQEAISVVSVQFREKHKQATFKDATLHWELWMSKQQYPRIRVLDTDHPNNVGVLEVKENALNAIKVRWHPQTGVAKIRMCVRCLSTDFTNQKGVKGIPLNIQVDTYAGEDTELSQVVDRAFCQIKTFTDGGANRKTYVDEQRLAMGRPGYKCQPAQQFSTFLRTVNGEKEPKHREAYLFQPSGWDQEEDDRGSMISQYTPQRRPNATSGTRHGGKESQKFGPNRGVKGPAHVYKNHQSNIRNLSTGGFNEGCSSSSETEMMRSPPPVKTNATINQCIRQAELAYASSPGELPRPQSTQSLPATMASAFSPLLSLGSPPLKPPMNRNQRNLAFGKGAKSATSGNKAKDQHFPSMPPLPHVTSHFTPARPNPGISIRSQRVAQKSQLATKPLLCSSPISQPGGHGSVAGTPKSTSESHAVTLFLRQENEIIFTALAVSPPTVQGFIEAVADKYQIDTEDIRNVFKKTLGKERSVVVWIDDQYFPKIEGQSFLMKVLIVPHETGSASEPTVESGMLPTKTKYDIVLVEENNNFY